MKAWLPGWSWAPPCLLAWGIELPSGHPVTSDAPGRVWGRGKHGCPHLTNEGLGQGVEEGRWDR